MLPQHLSSSNYTTPRDLAILAWQSAKVLDLIGNVDTSSNAVKLLVLEVKEYHQALLNSVRAEAAQQGIDLGAEIVAFGEEFPEITALVAPSLGSVEVPTGIKPTPSHSLEL